MIFFPLISIAQKDFDFTFYTTKSIIITSGGDTLYSTSLRKISKQGKRLCISSTANTSDEDTYTLYYVGFHWLKNEYTYTTDKDFVIYIRPCEGVVKIENNFDFGLIGVWE